MLGHNVCNGAGLAADRNGYGLIERGDYNIWRTLGPDRQGGGASRAILDSSSNFDEAVPEPASLALLGIGSAVWIVLGRSR